MDELWKDIQGYEGVYYVSNLGNVKSNKKILSQTKNKKGYCRVYLFKNGIRKIYRVNRLVAFAFIPLVRGKDIVNHKNGIRDDNRVENLEWNTQEENVNHAIRTGLKKLIYIDEEVLRRLYIDEGKSTVYIAELFGVSISKIRFELKKNNIGLRSISESNNKYNLTYEFILKELRFKSQKEIAKEAGCDPSLISKILKNGREKNE